jgi:hypothetical protein
MLGSVPYIKLTMTMKPGRNRKPVLQNGYNLMEADR